jgi:catechol 2,3-dioxygenase-like lactoylglutathione lyase family enzyme
VGDDDEAELAVLARGQLVAVVPVSDWREAIGFYRDTLGLPLAEEVASQNEARYAVGDAILITYQSVGAGQSRHTVAAFVVDDVDAAVADLRGRGVVFEEYDLPEIKTENGIAVFGDTREAWFRDPDGNLLAVGTRIADAAA